MRSIFALGPFKKWSVAILQISPFSFSLILSNLPKLKIGHAIYETWVVFHKELHGDNDLIIWAFSKCMQCDFALSPLNFNWICNCVCKFKCNHIIYGFGLVFYKDCNGDVLMMFCATHVDKVWSPDPKSICPFCLQHFNFSAFWNVDHLLFSSLFSCHLQSSFFKVIP